MAADESAWVRWEAADGTRLAAVRLGPEVSTARPVLCLPGLTRNSRDFAVLAAALAEGSPARTVIAVDYRGRGRSSFADPASYRPEVEADDVARLVDLLGWRQPAIVGTSRGGIIAMILAATRPDLVGPVVLNDIGPVIELGGLLAIRDRMTMMTGPSGPGDWTDAAQGLKAALGPAFPALADADWRRFARQLYRDDDGRPVLDYDPALATAFAGFDPAIGIPPFWPLFEALAAVPALAIRGELSDLLSEETLAAMAERHPRLAVHRVPDQGHAPLLDDAPTIARIGAFLDAADAG